MDGDVSHDLIRAEVAKILRSREFVNSARLQRFLQFIVEEYLAGRASRIKAYTIAVTVFDRGDDFDPSIHPIVRIEAGRLRRALQYYYLTEGKTARIHIDVPKGGYRPVVTECLLAIGEGLPQVELPRAQLPQPQPPRAQPAQIELPRADPTSVPASEAPPRLFGRMIAKLKARTAWICASCAAIAFLVTVVSCDDKSGSKSTNIVAALSTHKAAQVRQPAIILEPFQAYSGDAELGSFAQGVTDEVARYLSKNAALDVRYLSGDPTLLAGQTLAPDMFVSGGVRRAGDAVLIFVYLTPTPESSVAPAKCFNKDELESGRAIDEKDGAARCIASYVKEAVHSQKLR